MKREEILAMVPGRELDDLVMRTIFEARRAYHGEDEVWYHYDEDGKPDYEWDAYNSPSTRLNAAWEIAERYPIATVERVEIFEGNIEVKVTLWEGFDYREPVEATAKTAPEAICKAALIAVLDPINLPGEESE